MSDVLITPASKKIEFFDASSNIDGKIELDVSDNLVITNAGGDIIVGDSTSDIFVGDGVTSVDIVFEQSGEIRGTGTQTITLGTSGDTVAIGSGVTFTLPSTTLISNLNADLLDSLDSTSFLRSDADDSFSGTITNSGTFVSSVNNNLPTTSSRTKLGRDTVQFMTFHGGSSGNFMGSISTATNPKSSMFFGISTDDGATYDSTYTLSGSTGTIWHTGNDSTLLKTSTNFGGDVSGTYNNIEVTNDSHTHDTRYYTESEIDTKLTDGTVTKLANQWSNVTGNLTSYVNDGGGNLGFRFNATTGATNTLVEAGQAYEMEVENDTNGGDFRIYRGTTAGGLAGQTITWSEAFAIEGTDGSVRLSGTLCTPGVAIKNSAGTTQVTLWSDA